MKQNVLKLMVEEFLLKKVAFTSVDLTNMVKEKYGWIRNREVAAFLRSDHDFHEALDDHDYTRETITVTTAGGTPVQATLYLPILVDPSTYTNRSALASRPKKDSLQTAVDNSVKMLNAQLTADALKGAPVFGQLAMNYPTPTAAAKAFQKDTVKVVNPPAQKTTTKVIADAVKSYLARTTNSTFTYGDIVIELQATLPQFYALFDRRLRKQVSDYLRRNCKIVVPAANPAKDHNVYGR